MNRKLAGLFPVVSVAMIGFATLACNLPAMASGAYFPGTYSAVPNVTISTSGGHKYATVTYAWTTPGYYEILFGSGASYPGGLYLDNNSIYVWSGSLPAGNSNTSATHTYDLGTGSGKFEVEDWGSVRATVYY